MLRAEHGSPDAFASGECKLRARDDHARYAAFFFLAGTQCHEVAILLLYALDGRFIPKALLARLYEVERIEQPLLQIGRGDPRTTVPEGFRRKDLRRLRLSAIRLQPNPA